jgi:hypothetical protein
MLSYFRQNNFLRTRTQRQQPVRPSLLLSHFDPPRHVVELCRLRVEISINTSRKEDVWPGHRFLWSISQKFEPRLSQTKPYGAQNPFKALKSFYISLSLTWKISRFCQQSVFMYFVCICERIAIFFLYSTHWLVSITQMECAYCAVWAKSLNIFKIIHILYMVKLSYKYWNTKWTPYLALKYYVVSKTTVYIYVRRIVFRYGSMRVLRRKLNLSCNKIVVT